MQGSHPLCAVALGAAAAACASESSAVPADELIADRSIQCESCEGWNESQEPFRIYGDTFFVGTRRLSAILVVSDDGHILLDGALPQSAPLIAANIETLGYRLADVRLIVNSHAHFDHAGGIAALQRASGAEVAASPSGAEALARGEPTPDDPQYALVTDETRLTPVAAPRVVADNETLHVGAIALTAHLTPGHTPGSTTWTWVSCEQGRCLDMVYADSLTSVSADGFRFSGGDGRSSRVDSFRASIARVADLPCDVLMSPHPGFFGMEQKLLKRQADPETNPFIDPGACAGYAAAAQAALEARVAAEAGG